MLSLLRLGFVNGVAEFASYVPGPVGIIGAIVDFFSDLGNCTGPVVGDNIVYDPKALDNMTQGEKKCDTKNYTLESPSAVPLVGCGFDNSSYTVTYCLERLDEKKTSGAGEVLPGIIFTLVGFAVAMCL